MKPSGHPFDSGSGHQGVYGGAVVQLVRISACHAGGRGFKSRPLRTKYFADIAQLVERNLAKVEVKGSSPFVRSNFIQITQM